MYCDGVAVPVLPGPLGSHRLTFKFKVSSSSKRYLSDDPQSGREPFMKTVMNGGPWGCRCLPPLRVPVAGSFPDPDPVPSRSNSQPSGSRVGFVYLWLHRRSDSTSDSQTPGRFKNLIPLRGVWVAQSVKLPTPDLGSGHDLTVHEIEPHLALC